ncbi:interleukin-6 receptor subunit beta-like isoform X2 [Stigmatopora nigra]
MDSGWLLLILIANMSISDAFEGSTPAPSIPDCYIPTGESYRVDIHCSWNHGSDPHVITNYSLHWETANNVFDHVNTGTNLSGFIGREHFSMNSELSVWVEAESKHGSAKSQVVVLNTGNLVKPSPPIITSSQQDPLEITWSSICSESHLFLGPCDVRFRNEVDQFWHEEKIGAQVHYELNDPIRAGLVYEFQVRCSCATGIKSNWSGIHRIRTSETAPTGQMDIWKDCGVPATNSDCSLIWKKISLSQANGRILGYEIKQSSQHSRSELLNVSIAEPRNLLVCDEQQCYLNTSLKNVSSASVSAYNAHGATVHSYLAIPAPGKVRSEVSIDVSMNTENLTVSWDSPLQLPDVKLIKEYVVQYKQAGCHLGEGFDWIRVNKSCTSVTFKGHFEKYRPYQVSLFAVTDNQQSHHISSVFGFSSHGIPAKVPSFKVISIAATHATLLWEPIPLTMQNGLILFYEIGVLGQNVYNVSASTQDGNKMFELQNLSVNQEYEVGIKAVTAAGPGAKVTTSFITKASEHLVLKSKTHLFSFLLLLCLPAILCCFLVLFSKKTNKACLCFNQKIPDPYNSTIFKMIKNQVNDPVPWSCITINEPLPSMSVLELVEIRCPQCEQVYRPKDQTRPAESSKRCICRTHRNSRDEYKEMVDSDEEMSESGAVGKDKCGSSSEDEQDVSGYEQHFMPTVGEENIMSGAAGRDNCGSSSEDEQIGSGYEEHFMPTATEVRNLSGAAGRGNSWSSLEDEQDVSGYEQHFMPTAADILNA